MIYWYVERKSVCVYSQLKACSSSEVAAMIEGLLRHCTESSCSPATPLLKAKHGSSTLKMMCRWTEWVPKAWRDAVVDETGRVERIPY